MDDQREYSARHQHQHRLTLIDSMIAASSQNFQWSQSDEEQSLKIHYLKKRINNYYNYSIGIPIAFH